MFSFKKIGLGEAPDREGDYSFPRELVSLLIKRWFERLEGISKGLESPSISRGETDDSKKTCQLGHWDQGKTFPGTRWDWAE